MNIEYSLSKDDLLQYSLEISEQNAFINFLLSHGNIIGAMLIFIISIIMLIRHKILFGILFLFFSVVFYFCFSFFAGVISGKSVISNYLDPIYQNMDVNIHLEFTEKNICKNRDLIYNIEDIKYIETKSFVIIEDNKNEKIIIPKNKINKNILLEIMKGSAR